MTWSMTSPTRWLDDPVESGPAAGFGLYLHVPFCSHRCGYCDFATYGRDELRGDPDEVMARYVAGLRGEIRRWSERRDWPPVTSVFVGGGTPTLLPAADLVGVIDVVREVFAVDEDAEVTVEANPETAAADLFAALADAGVTRLSLGAQSFAPHVLDVLERQHDPAAPARAVKLARDAGIHDVNLDLIYGTPGETDADWTDSLERVLELGVDHVSAYALTVADNTALARHVTAGRVPAPDPDVQRDRFEQAREILGGRGFDHYEVSNWARTPAHRSRHNVLYWRHGHYLGIGVGAHAHVDGRRWWSHRSLDRWLSEVAAGRDPVAGDEELTLGQRADERLMLGLRLREGLHPHDAPPLLPETLGSAARDGLVSLACGRIQATPRGWFLLDTILGRLEVDGARLDEAGSRR